MSTRSVSVPCELSGFHVLLLFIRWTGTVSPCVNEVCNVPIICTTDDGWINTDNGWNANWQDKQGFSGKKSCLAANYSKRIMHWDWTQASEVRSRQITPSGMWTLTLVVHWMQLIISFIISLVCLADLENHIL